MIKKYQSKPKIIEAIHYDGLNFMEVEAFVGRRLDFAVGYNVPKPLVIPTLEGEHIASAGDYIIKGIRGEFYPVKSEIFLESYEEL